MTYRLHALVCGGTGCTSSGSPKIMEALQNEIERQGLEEEMAVAETDRHGLRAPGPIMIVYPDVTLYSMIQPEDIPEIAAEHLLKGRVVTRLLYQETISPNGGIRVLSDTGSYKEQHYIALRNCGVIDPESVEGYIGIGGYQALGKVLTETTPGDVIQTLFDAGLRGHGGAGFSTGLKQKLYKQNDTDQKYVCCNAGEDDPDAFMDRSVLGDDPHALLEAMAIVGYTIGSNQGYVYVRAEYPIAMECLKTATNQAREMKLLGEDTFETGFDFGADIRPGTGAFAYGEETTLMASIKGKRGESGPRPLFPAQKGLLGKPGILNNVEIYANIPQIIPNRPGWLASMGIKKSEGTKVFTLGGKISNTDLVEVPMGTTLRAVIDEIGGGIPGDKEFKATQASGPSDGCIPVEHFGIPTDYDSLLSIGSMIGSGGFIVTGEDDCMVDIAKFFLEFTVEESYGKCTACRIGIKHMLGILEKITKGTAEMADLDRLEELCHYVRVNSLCGLGQIAPNPVLSTLHFFRDEYEVRIKEERCPVGVCKAPLSYVIDRDKCCGCTLCARTYPADTIVGNVKNPHVIDLNKCIKCGACMGKCKFDAIYKE